MNNSGRAVVLAIASSGCLCSCLFASPGETDIRPTRNNSSSIITIIKDDGFYGSTKVYCELLEKNGIKGKVTEAIITDTVGNWSSRGTWEKWTELYNTGYLDFANHTRTHAHLTQISDQQLDAEINGAKEILEEKFPEVDILLAIVPFAERNEKVTDKVKEKHWSLKGGGGDYKGYNSLSPTDEEWYYLMQKQIISSTSSETMKSWVDHAIKNEAWVILATHGCDDKSWEPVPCDYWDKLFAHLASSYDPSEYWFEGAGLVTKYIRERQNAKLKIISSSARQISLSLTDELPNDVFDYPLLLRTEVPGNWQRVDVVQGKGASKKVAPVKEDGVSYAYYEAVPDKGQIRLSAD